MGDFPPWRRLGPERLGAELAEGRWVKGLICESHGLADATDITSHGGWRAHLAALRSEPAR